MGRVIINMGGGRKETRFVCDHKNCRTAESGTPSVLVRKGWKITFFSGVYCPAHA